MTEHVDDSESPAGIWARTTAPQSTFSTRDVLLGAIVLVVGLAVAFGLPLLAA